jgi:GAF domain-containing protein
MTDDDTGAPAPSAWLEQLSLELRSSAGVPSGDRLHDRDRLAAIVALGADDEQHVQPLVADLLEHAALALGAEVSLLSVVLTDAHLVAGEHGLGGWLVQARAIPVEWSLCATVVRTGQPWMVPDLAVDARTRDNPLRDLDNLHAYAGAPLVTDSGQVLGALCVLYDAPRSFSDSEVDVLRGLADQAMARLQAASAAV